jgi:hypothetical protein
LREFEKRDGRRKKEQEEGENYTMRIYIFCNPAKRIVITKIKTKV